MNCPPKVGHNFWGVFMKYSYEEKLSAVHQVVLGHHGVKTVARALGFHHEHLRRLVKLYEAYGAEGLRIRHGSYSLEFKLSVLDYMYKNHLSLKQAAVKFGIPSEGTLHHWSRLYTQEGVLGLSPKKRGRKKMKSPKEKKPKKPLTVEEQLRRENELLRAENALLKKVKALVKEQDARLPVGGPKPSKD